MEQFRTSSDSEVVDRDPDSGPRRTHRIQLIQSDSDDLSDSLSDRSADPSGDESGATDTSDVSEPLDRQTVDELGGPNARRDSSAGNSKVDFSTMLSVMARDDVSAAVTSDACLVEYGEHLYGRCPHGRLRHKMRELGRLLICSRRSGPLKTMRDHVAAANFMHAVRAVMRASGFDGDTNTYGRPSLALKLGRDLKAMSRLAESRAGERGDRAAARDARAFRAAYEASWSELLSDGRLTRKVGIFQKDELQAPRLLPFTTDVQALHSYLDAQQQRFRRELSEERTPRKWALLAQITLTQVVLFNRRRTREVSNMSLSAYLVPDRPEPKADGNAALSELEKELCQHFGRIGICGETGGRVPVLLTPPMQQALDLLVSWRRECRVPLENTYLFARPSAMSCFQGDDSLRFFARFCGAKSPEGLTSPKLRKQTGTLSQVLNLRSAELDRLADFLGRDVSADWQFYRRPEGTLPLAKISKLLMALDRGRLAGSKGRSLEDVSIDPDEVVLMDSEDESQLPDVSRPAAAPQGEIKTFRCKFPKRKCGLRAWRPEEVAAVEKHMAAFIASRRLPRKRDCERCLGLETAALSRREWSSIRGYVKNRIAGKNV